MSQQLTNVFNKISPEILAWCQKHNIYPQQVLSSLWNQVSASGSSKNLEESLRDAWEVLRKQIGSVQLAEEDEEQDDVQPSQDNKTVDYNDWKERLKWEISRLTTWGSRVSANWTDQLKTLQEEAITQGESSQIWKDALIAKWNELTTWEGPATQQEQG